MTLSRYLSFLFLQAFLGISAGLTIIYNLIELMEKLTRTNHMLGEILPFLALNLIPTWLDMLPISSWLAMLVLIYRLQLQEEWFTCRLLGLKDRQLLLPLIISLLLTTAGVITVRQLGGESLRSQVQQYHARVFKHRPSHASLNQWYTLPAERSRTSRDDNRWGRDDNRWGRDDNSLDLVHIQHFDHATQRGNGLTWYHFNDGTVDTHEYMPTFALQDNTLHAPRSEQYHYDTQQFLTRHTLRQKTPALAHAIHQQVKAPSLLGLVTAWWQAPAGSAHKEKIGLELAAEALPLVEIIFFALFTLLLFLLLPLGTKNPLLFAASGYPLCLFLKNVLSALCLGSFFIVITGYFILLVVAKVGGSRILKIAVTRF